MMFNVFGLATWVRLSRSDSDSTHLLKKNKYHQWIGYRSVVVTSLTIQFSLHIITLNYHEPTGGIVFPSPFPTGRCPAYNCIFSWTYSPHPYGYMDRYLKRYPTPHIQYPSMESILKLL